MSDEVRQYGNVVWFSPSRGIGFCSVDGDNKSDIFVHYSQITMEGYKTLEAGQRVSFLIGANHKGPMAADVRIED